MSRFIKVYLFIAFYGLAAASSQAYSQDFNQVEKWLFKLYGKDTLKRTIHLDLGGISLGLLNLIDDSVDLEKDSPVKFDHIDKVVVRVYEFQNAKSRKIPAGLQKKFTRQGWSLVMRSISEDSRMVAFFKMEKKTRASITLFVQNDDKLVVIGIGGRISDDSV